MTLKANLLTIDQLADELNVARRTVQRWHAERTGPPRLKIGKKVYYRLDAVQEWMLAHEQAEPRAKKTPGRAS